MNGTYGTQAPNRTCTDFLSYKFGLFTSQIGSVAYDFFILNVLLYIKTPILEFEI